MPATNRRILTCAWMVGGSERNNGGCSGKQAPAQDEHKQSLGQGIQLGGQSIFMLISQYGKSLTACWHVETKAQLRVFGLANLSCPGVGGMGNVLLAGCSTFSLCWRSWLAFSLSILRQAEMSVLPQYARMSFWGQSQHNGPFPKVARPGWFMDRFANCFSYLHKRSTTSSNRHICEKHMAVLARSHACKGPNLQVHWLDLHQRPGRVEVLQSPGWKRLANLVLKVTRAVFHVFFETCTRSLVRSLS